MVGLDKSIISQFYTFWTAFRKSSSLTTLFIRGIEELPFTSLKWSVLYRVWTFATAIYQFTWSCHMADLQNKSAIFVFKKGNYGQARDQNMDWWYTSWSGDKIEKHERDFEKPRSTVFLIASSYFQNYAMYWAFLKLWS